LIFKFLIRIRDFQVCSQRFVPFYRSVVPFLFAISVRMIRGIYVDKCGILCFIEMGFLNASFLQFRVQIQ